MRNRDLVSKAHAAIMALHEASSEADEPPLEVKTEALVVPKSLKPPTYPEAFWSVRKGPPVTKIFSDSDNHYPLNDPRVEAAKIAFIRDVRPDLHVNAGDQYDLHHLSSFPKEPARLLDYDARLQAEFDAAQPYWREISRIVPESHLILGNHEERLARLVKLNIGLFDLRALQWQVLADLPKTVQVHPYGTRLKVGELTFEHGDRVGGRYGARHPSDWLLINKPCRNTIFGHSHKLSAEHRTIWEWTEDAMQPVVYGAWNQGHGCDSVKQLDWSPDCNWTNGFTYVEVFSGGFTVHQIPVIFGKFSFGGRVYDGRKCM